LLLAPLPSDLEDESVASVLEDESASTTV